MKEFRYIIHIVLLFAIQVVILNNIQLSSYINLNIYILALLFLPFQLNHTLIMLGSFLLGWIIDISTHTIGVHTFSLTLLAFIRPRIMMLMAPREQLDNSANLYKMSHIGWFYQYMFILTFIFNVSSIMMESFSFHNFGILCIRILLSTLFSFLLIFLYYIIAMRKEEGTSSLS